MTNYNKINQEQKNLMGEFMKEHPNLAKNLIPNCALGKATAVKLWDSLKNKLNAVGPPIKDAKAWRKVFADQKYQAKKKLSFNKASKRKTGGGPFQEMVLTQAEENIAEASGLEVAVEGLLSVSTFGICAGGNNNEKETPSPPPSNVDFNFMDSDDDGNEFQKEASLPKNLTRKKSKLTLLEENLKATNDQQRRMEEKFDEFLNIQKRLLAMKEEKHKGVMASMKLDLEIKALELEVLKKKVASFKH